MDVGGAALVKPGIDGCEFNDTIGIGEVPSSKEGFFLDGSRTSATVASVDTSSIS